MMYRMRFLTHRLSRRPWSATPVNENTPGLPAETFGQYQELMDVIEPGSPQGVPAAAALAKAIAGRLQGADPADEVEACLQAFILFVVWHGKPSERTLQTVKELITDKECFAGALFRMQQAAGGKRPLFRLFARRIGLWTEEKRAAVVAAAKRRLAFLPAVPGPRNPDERP